MISSFIDCAPGVAGLLSQGGLMGSIAAIFKRKRPLMLVSLSSAAARARDRVARSEALVLFVNVALHLRSRMS